MGQSLVGFALNRLEIAKTSVFYRVFMCKPKNSLVGFDLNETLWDTSLVGFALNRLKITTTIVFYCVFMCKSKKSLVKLKVS